MYRYTEFAGIYIFHYSFNEQHLHTTNDTGYKYIAKGPDIFFVVPIVLVCSR